MYSLSKALLNVLTRVIHEYIHNHLYTTVTSGIGIEYDKCDGIIDNIRIISVCPGDFESSMSTEDEIKTARNVDISADSILKVALGSKEDFPSGYFYRDGIKIDW